MATILLQCFHGANRFCKNVKINGINIEHTSIVEFTHLYLILLDEFREQTTAFPNDPGRFRFFLL